MTWTIDTCTAAVYVALSNFFVSHYLLPTLCATFKLRCRFSVLLTHTHALYLSSSDPKFQQLERFLNNVRISIPSSNGQRTKTIHGLIERAGKFVFSKNDGRESTVAVRFFIISILSLYPVAKALLPGYLQHPYPLYGYIRCKHIWQKQPASKRHPCRVVSSTNEKFPNI
jgi:hypothetical protein